MSISFSYTYNLRNVCLVGAWFAICRGGGWAAAAQVFHAILFSGDFSGVSIIIVIPMREAGQPMSSSSCTPQRGDRHAAAAAEQSSSGGMCWIRIFLLANNRDNIPAIHSGQYLVCEFANRTRLYWCKFRILRQPPSRPRRMSPTEYTYIYILVTPIGNPQGTN